MNPGKFINLDVPFKHGNDYVSFDDQATQILTKAKALIDAGSKGVAITYSANFHQTRTIEQVYFNGGWDTVIQGDNQAQTMISMVKLQHSTFAELQGKMRICPISTMQGSAQIGESWTQELHKGILIADLDRVERYLESGWDVLGWQNQITVNDPSHPYAVGGGIVKLDTAINDLIQGRLIRLHKKYSSSSAANLAAAPIKNTPSWPPTPQPKSVNINGQDYSLVAFYYPGHDTPWDKIYQGQVFTNFFPCQINLTINEISATFHTAEAAFQSTKWWDNDSNRQRFEKTTTGDEAYHLKKRLADPNFSYAGLGRDGAMQKVLADKFSDPNFKKLLLGTGDAYLLEHNAKKGIDRYWSDNHDGTGHNMLGKSLMELRKLFGGKGEPDGSYSVKDFTEQVL